MWKIFEIKKKKNYRKHIGKFYYYRKISEKIRRLKENINEKYV